MITSARTDSLSRCAKEAQHLAQELATTSSSARSHDADDGVRESRVRLIDSAARVLMKVTDGLGRSLDVETTPPAGQETARPIGERLWDLTCAVTMLSAEGLLTSIDEATAALQELSCVFAESGADVSARIRALRKMQRETPGRILLRRNGPYVATNVAHITNWLGEQVAIPPQIALCRCARAQPLRRRQGSKASERSPGYLQGSATDRARQPRHVRALGLLHRSFVDCLPPGSGAVCRTKRSTDG